MIREPSNFQKIYFQLAPSPMAREFLREISNELQLEPEAVQIVDPDTWHLTVIHIGNINTIWQQLNTDNDELTFKRFKSLMQHWAERQQQRVAGKTYQLAADSVDFLGGNASALVVRFTADNELLFDHQQAYSDLVGAWASLGINQPVMMLRSLPELKFAHSLTAHVTLARGVNVNISLSEIDQKKVTFTPMKFFYGLYE